MNINKKKKKVFDLNINFFNNNFIEIFQKKNNCRNGF